MRKAPQRGPKDLFTLLSQATAKDGLFRCGDHKSTENNRPLLIVAQGAKSAKDFTFSGIGTDDPGNSHALGAA